MSKPRKPTRKKHFQLKIGKNWRIVDWSLPHYLDPDLQDHNRRRRGVKANG